MFWPSLFSDHLSRSYLARCADVTQVDLAKNNILGHLAHLASRYPKFDGIIRFLIQSWRICIITFFQIVSGSDFEVTYEIFIEYMKKNIVKCLLWKKLFFLACNFAKNGTNRSEILTICAGSNLRCSIRAKLKELEPI